MLRIQALCLLCSEQLSTFSENLNYTIYNVTIFCGRNHEVEKRNQICQHLLLSSTVFRNQHKRSCMQVIPWYVVIIVTEKQHNSDYWQTRLTPILYKHTENYRKKTKVSIIFYLRLSISKNLFMHLIMYT